MSDTRMGEDAKALAAGLRERAANYRRLHGNMLYYGEGDALVDDAAADVIETAVAALSKIANPSRDALLADAAKELQKLADAVDDEVTVNGAGQALLAGLADAQAFLTRLRTQAEGVPPPASQPEQEGKS